MAENTSSLVKLRGDVDGLTFYAKDGKQFVRRTRKSNKEKFDNDPSMVRVRENAAEFKNVSQSAKRLWDTLRPFTANNKDSKSYLRLRSIMNELKKMDTTSLRGERDALNGLTEAAGKQLLKGFNFNSKSQLDSILFKQFELNTDSGKLMMEQFNPSIHLASEPSSTHYSITLCKADIDINSGKSELAMSNVHQAAVNGSTEDVVLQLETTTHINGLQLFVLQIAFYQEMNGQLYPLKDKAHNASKIIDVL
ncbi:MAG: hypothetical protein RBS19_11655 [Bacteroidales bacterium]|nr:hypothetical protein [Bacteroidales bacterium]